jgi:PleD family two-component response regulator
MSGEWKRSSATAPLLDSTIMSATRVIVVRWDDLTKNRVNIMRVLLVEDSSELRRLFARVLEGNGFEVCEAANGREALDCLPGFVPDVILTDLMMPVLDGFELIRRLRAMPTMAEVPIRCDDRLSVVRSGA